MIPPHGVCGDSDPDGIKSHVKNNPDYILRSVLTVLFLVRQAEEAQDPDRAARFSQRAKKLSIISIVMWVTFLAMIPILMALISYLLTLRD